MNTNKIKNIIKLLNNFDRVVLVKEDVLVTIVTTSEVLGESYNEVLYLGWEVDGNEYCVKFDEGGLNSADIDNGELVMEDIEGDIIRIEFQSIIKHDLVIEEID